MQRLTRNIVLGSLIWGLMAGTSHANCNPASGTKSACKQIEENEAIKAAAKKNILELLKKKKNKAPVTSEKLMEGTTKEGSS